jgi:thioester reductase-like protein
MKRNGRTLIDEKVEMSAQQILITGGDGYTGLRLARKYLEQAEEGVLLWVRASCADAFQAKKERLCRELNDFNGRVNYAWGDLVNENPFEAVDPKEVKTIIHSAAATRFNVDEVTARKVNVEGTEKLLRFASRCESLEALGLLSTVYASGLRSGVIEESGLNGQDGFANFYESSKWMAENVLRTEFAHLPWRIFRIATIIADDDNGRVTQYNSFHNTLKLIFYGLLSLIPGDPETPLYFVTGEFVTDTIYELMERPENKVIYHVSHTADESLLLGELIDVAFDVFLQDKDFELRRVLKPLYSDAESFELLTDAVNAFGSVIVNQAVSSVAPFARQLFVHKKLQNKKLVSALDSYRAPDVRHLIRNTCEYLVSTKWGRYPAGDGKQN